MSNVKKTDKVAFSLRDMTAADLDRVAEMERSIFPDPWPKNTFREILGEDGWGCLVVEHGSEVVAYGCYYFVDVEAHLTNIAVDSAYRRKSVAKRILDAILERAAESGCEYVILEVRPSNTAARAFYGKHGFKNLYERPNYYRRPVESALVMVRYLDHHTEA